MIIPMLKSEKAKNQASMDADGPILNSAHLYNFRTTPDEILSTHEFFKIVRTWGPVSLSELGLRGR